MQPNTPEPQQPQPSPQPSTPPPAGISKIRHTRPGIGFGSAPASASGASETSVPLNAATTEAPPPGTAGSKIRMFGQERRHEEQWTRTPNTTGSGAIHVKSFHCKLTDACSTWTRDINEWLDAHPQYEVKFVGSMHRHHDGQVEGAGADLPGVGVERTESRNQKSESKRQAAERLQWSLCARTMLAASRTHVLNLRVLLLVGGGLRQRVAAIPPAETAPPSSPSCPA